MFNLSFLDILSGALGAVLFLFIVVPKGGESPKSYVQLNLTMDTLSGKFFGEIPDTLQEKSAGDSLLVLITDFQRMPEMKDCPPQKKCPDCPKCPKVNKLIVNKPSTKKEPTQLAALKPLEEPKLKAKESPTPATTASKYKGDLPSVPCKLSVEVKWVDIKNNVDLFVCKDGNCVYGARRRNSAIGFWDSGKSKTSIFGGDLRTTQEAVRQFDTIIEGEYNIYAQFKATENDINSLLIDALVYTKSEDGQDKGETFSVELPFNKNERTLLGKMVVQSDGSFTLSKNF